MNVVETPTCQNKLQNKLQKRKRAKKSRSLVTQHDYKLYYGSNIDGWLAKTARLKPLKPVSFQEMTKGFHKEVFPLNIGADGTVNAAATLLFHNPEKKKKSKKKHKTQKAKPVTSTKLQIVKSEPKTKKKSKKQKQKKAPRAITATPATGTGNTPSTTNGNAAATTSTTK